MAEKSSVNLIVTLGVVLLLTAALIVSISDETNKKSARTYINNQTITVTRDADAINVNLGANYTIQSLQTGWRTESGSDGCAIAGVSVRNQTYATLTNAVDYNITLSTGILKFYNTVPLNRSGSNTTYIDYNYCGEGYMNQSWGRDVLKIVPALIAVALLVLTALAFYQLFGNRDYE